MAEPGAVARLVAFLFVFKPFRDRDPRARHILSLRSFPSSSDSRRVSCQLLAKECALSIGKPSP